MGIAFRIACISTSFEGVSSICLERSGFTGIRIREKVQGSRTPSEIQSNGWGNPSFSSRNGQGKMETMHHRLYINEAELKYAGRI